MDWFETYHSLGVYTIYETDDRDPFGDDRLRLDWDHPAFARQGSLRFSSFPIAPDDEPQASCQSRAGDAWPRDALARHFGCEGCLAAMLPAEELFRMSPAELSGGRVRRRATQSPQRAARAGNKRASRYNES